MITRSWEKGGVPYPPDTHSQAPGRCGSAYLDDAAAPGGRSCRLQEASLAIRGDPRIARQRNPAATVPHPAPRGLGCSVPGGSIGAGSRVVFAPRNVERRRSLPASRALSHGQARSRLPARQHDRQRRPALSKGALRHQKETPLDFVSARDGGCSGGRNFVERRHHSGRGVLGLWSRRSAAGADRRRGRGEDVSGREKQAKSSGRYRRREASAGSAQTKDSGRRSPEPPNPPKPGRARPERRLRTGHQPPARRPRSGGLRKCGGGCLHSARL